MSEGVLLSMVLIALAVPVAAQQRVSPLEFRVTERWRVGTEDGDPNTVFGAVDDIAVSPTAVYVADTRLQVVRVLSRKGAPLAAIGRPGRGPGEFVYPKAVEISATGDILVLDQLERRIARFQRLDTTFVLKDERRIDFDAFDMCRGASSLIVLGYSQGKVLHVLDHESRRPRHSYGAPWGPEHPLLTPSLARGKIACAPDAGLVAVASSLWGEVRVYSEDGALLWAALPPSFEREIIDIGPRTVQHRFPESGKYNSIASVLFANSRVVVVQIRTVWRKRSDRDEDEPLQTVLFEAKTGRVLAFRSGVPRLVALAGTSALGSTDSPYPQVIEFAMTLPPQLETNPSSRETTR